MRYLLFLFLIGCGGRILLPDCERFQAGGLTVCTEKPVDALEVIHAINLVTQEAVVYYPEAISLDATLLQYGVTANFLDAEYLATNCRETDWDGLYECEQYIAGQNRNGVEIIVEWHPCVGHTALMHELIHSIDILILNSSEEQIMSHMTPHLFAEWGLRYDNMYNTVEMRAYDRFICP